MKDAIEFMVMLALVFLTFAAAGLAFLLWMVVLGEIRDKFRSKTPPKKPRVSWPPID